jgi:uncharacterized membrane protein YdfJ with MMPL/SSD domain
MILPSIMTLLGKASWWPSRTMRRAQSAPREDVANLPTAQFQPSSGTG